jgi:RNA polymerase sigma-70 factor (ECF subfamily)
MTRMSSVDPDLIPEPGTPAQEAVPLLLDAYGDRLYQLGLRNCGSHSEAQDLMQETMMEALKSWDSFEGRSTPSTWLFRIAFRMCQRMHRLRAGEPSYFEPLDRLLDGPSASPTGGAQNRLASPPPTPLRSEELQLRLDAALSSVPEDFRIALVLKDIADFSLQEVAEILDLRPATVKTRVHRGRLHLRRALQAGGIFEPLPPVTMPRRVCLDLLRAKLDSMDRDVPFPYPHGEICDRCSALFQSLDLTQQACASLRAGDVPPDLRDTLRALLRDGDANPRST